MKNLRSIATAIVAAAFCSLVMTSCGVTSGMSYQEAYDYGYNIGSSLRRLIDN